MSTLHLPTTCDSCDRTWLAPHDSAQVATCPACNEPAHVVPGETYRAEDVALFEKIESTMREADLAESTSRRLWAILSNVSDRGRRPELLLLPVVDTLPALHFVSDHLSEDRAQLARTLGMILVVVTAHLRVLEARHAAHETLQRAEPAPT
jgi:hypothetical protein